MNFKLFKYTSVHLPFKFCKLIKFLYCYMEKSGVNLLANSTFTSQFFAQPTQPDMQKCINAIVNNQIEILHTVFKSALEPSTENQHKPLLHYAAFHNSPVSALLILRRGVKVDQCDGEGKSVFHLCAYTGHSQVLMVIRNHIKLQRIQQLSAKYIDLLNSNNYKRTDVKNGKLKFSVSQTRQKSFDRMQQTITGLYEQYIFTMMDATRKDFLSIVKNTNRNCFHLGCLNRYQRCYSTLEYIFDQFTNFNIHLDHSINQMYVQVNNCMGEGQKVDPRLFQDTIAMIEETILPNKLSDIKKEIERRVQQTVASIMESKDKDGHTPLYIASKNGCIAIINLLKKWQGNMVKASSNKQDLIKIASHNLARSHIMDLCQASRESDSKNMNFLISCGEEINKKKTIFGTFALLQAVKSFQKQRNIESIRILILSGADINEQDTNGWTVLHHACERGLKPVLQQIFKIWEQGKTKKILINKMTNKNYHMLHLAAMNNHPQIIQFLLASNSAKKLQLNDAAVDGDKCTMLHHAARKGSLQALKIILQLNSSLIYQTDVRKNTALHYAAMSDHTLCIKYLIYFDGDFDKLQQMQNSRGKLAKDLTVNKKPFQNIFGAARGGDVNQVRKMISQNVELKKIKTLQKQRTLLILAVLNKHLLVVKYLVEGGSDQTHKDKLNKTARQYALDLQKNTKSKQEAVVIKNILTLLPP